VFDCHSDSPLKLHLDPSPSLLRGQGVDCFDVVEKGQVNYQGGPHLLPAKEPFLLYSCPFPPTPRWYGVDEDGLVW